MGAKTTPTTSGKRVIIVRVAVVVVAVAVIVIVAAAIVGDSLLLASPPPIISFGRAQTFARRPLAGAQVRPRVRPPVRPSVWRLNLGPNLSPLQTAKMIGRCCLFHRPRATQTAHTQKERPYVRVALD